MSDPLDPFAPCGGDPQPQGEVYPWDEPLDVDPDAPRQRHDAFTEARKNDFLRVLVKTGCILDACRRTGINPRTLYRHQERDPRFSDHCRLALRMSGTPIELTAWSRAVEGVDQEFACGGQVHVRRRYDGSLLRLLLQGSNPKKYGPRPGFTRKRILRHERKQMEREIRAEIGAKTVASPQEAMKALSKRLAIFGKRTGAEDERTKLAAGWTKSPNGDWVPPGYAPIAGYDRRADAPALLDGPGTDGPDPSTPRESM